MLFRFSALTFNSHRIHYDRPYAVEMEKLPNLVVQGKLIALHLLETVRHFAPEARRGAVRISLHASALCRNTVQAGCQAWFVGRRFETMGAECRRKDRASRKHEACDLREAITMIGKARDGILSILLLCVLSGASAAQDAFPNRAMRLIVPYPAGGTSDTLARALGNELNVALGQPVVIENRPGGGTAIGAQAAAKSPPDGYTLLFVSDQTLTTLPMLHKNLPFDPAAGFRADHRAVLHGLGAGRESFARGQQARGPGCAREVETRFVELWLVRDRQPGPSGNGAVQAGCRSLDHARAVERRGPGRHRSAGRLGANRAFSAFRARR